MDSNQLLFNEIQPKTSLVGLRKSPIKNIESDRRQNCNIEDNEALLNVTLNITCLFTIVSFLFSRFLSCQTPSFIQRRRS
ncbi:hypothetical protein M5689_023375 [Euphorbia peplus]|nr:hypothetical protein M5689_023375 [Euphorbia peplus]